MSACVLCFVSEKQAGLGDYLHLRHAFQEGLSVSKTIIRIIFFLEIIST